MKICSQWPADAFGADRHAKDGRTHACRDCRRAASQNPERLARRSEVARAWRAANSERHAANGRRYYEANRDKVRAKHAVWRAANKRRHAELTNAWRRTHPENNQVKLGRRRDRRRGGTGGELTARQWKEILLFYGNACGLCHVSADVKPLTIDHFIPIAKGGTHNWMNVWPLCFPCNRTKSNTVPSGAPPHVAVLMLTAAKEAIA